MRLASYELTIAASLSAGRVHVRLEDGRMGVPPEAVEDHERRWAYFLGLLRDAV